MANNKSRDAEKLLNVKMTRKLTGVCSDTVYKVLRGERENETVESVYMTIQELRPVYENALMAAVKKIVPFN